MTLLIFLIVLVVLILVHEFGHFIVAKLSGIRVDEFGIGFPPKLFGKKYGETEYTVNALPIGGFVKIYGEDPTEEQYAGADSERSFVRKPRYIQAAVLVAGVVMNIVLAFVLYSTTYMLGMPTAVAEGEVRPYMDTPELYVTSVLPDSPAATTLQTGDQIVSIARDNSVLTGEDALSPRAVSNFIAQSDAQTVTLDIVRHGKPLEVTVTPQAGVVPESPERAAAGFTLSLVGMERLPFLQALVAGAQNTYQTLVHITVGLGTLAAQVVHGTADLTHVAGPVGIVTMVGDAAALGLSWLLTFTAFISLNLAVINLLPIPALDGGRLVFVIIEGITRRTIKPVIARTVNQVGFVALLLLMVLVTAHDVLRLFS